MIDPSTSVLPWMSMLPATTTPTSVLGAAVGSRNEPISMFVCGATIVAVWSAVLLNIVAPVNSHELVKWVYADGTSDAIGPFIVQLSNRRLFPCANPYEFVEVSTVVLLNEPLFIRCDQVMPSFL